MAGAFPDLADFLDDTLDLPYKGKTYSVPDPGAETGLYLQSMMDAAESLIVTQAIAAADKKVLSDDQERSVYQMALGSAYEEMLADKVPWRVLRTAGITAWLYWTGREDQALARWTTLGKAPKADEPKGEPTSSDSSPTDPSTPPPASPAGTTSP